MKCGQSISNPEALTYILLPETFHLLSRGSASSRLTPSFDFLENYHLTVMCCVFVKNDANY
jgi:hypothetical protein